MSVYYNHDITYAPASRRVPQPLWLVRPHGPRGTPGVRAEFNDFDAAFKAAQAYDHALVFKKPTPPQPPANAVKRLWRRSVCEARGRHEDVFEWHGPHQLWAKITCMYCGREDAL